MTEYISREAAIKAAFRLCNKTDYPFIDDIQNALEELPAADVRPVVRGSWEGETDFIYADLSQRVICGKCGAFAYFYDKMPMNFCPNCGADMREVDADGES